MKYQVKKAKGKRGIRTLGTNNSYNGLAIRRFSPLSHLSQLTKKDNYCIPLREKLGFQKFFLSLSISII